MVSFGGESRYFDGVVGVVESLVPDVIRLNHILAEVLFHEGRSGEPTHLDLDDECFALINKNFGLEQQAFTSQLIDVVCSISSSQSPAGVFGIFSEATRRWNNRRETFPEASLDVPPSLSLLGMLSLAAESMRPSSDEDEKSETFSASAYYGRLKQVANRDSWTVENIQKEYRDHKMRFKVGGEKEPRALGLWRSLESWLLAWEDERGLCTVTFPKADRKGRWAVDMPVSQALLRDADRENIRKMFGYRNLNPSVPVSEEMMFVLIDEWCGTYGTQHLKKVWKHADYRESVVGAALNTLLTWTGVPSTTQDESRTQSVGVGLTIDLNAFTRRADIGVEIRTGTATAPESIDIVDENGSMVRTSIQPVGPRISRVTDCISFDVESLVAGILKVSNKDHGLVGHRYPRPIVPFLASSAGNAYTEVSTMTLSARHGVLVRARTDDGHDLLADVTNHLEHTARPGWSVVDSARFSGIPSGWVFIQNVDMVSYPTENLSHTHLVALLPLATESVSLSGGFRVPGRRERWLTSSAPSVLAVFPFETSVVLTVKSSTGEELHSLHSTERVAVVDLSDLGLAPGAYTVEAAPDSGLSLRKTVYLVGADTPNPSVLLGRGRVGHVLSGPGAFGVISAEPLENIPEESVIVRGLDIQQCVGSPLPESSDLPDEIPHARMWSATEDDAPSAISNSVKIERPPVGSCLVNRSHHWMLPKADRGPAPSFIEGHCKYCNFVKQLPGRPVVKSEFKRNHQKRIVDTAPTVTKKTTALPKEAISAIPPIEISEKGLWDNAFEAVCYLRTGSVADLVSIVGQVGGGSIGVDRIIRSLSSLGHIDVHLDSNCRPRTWSVSPAVVVVTSSTEAHLAGFRSNLLLEAMESRITNAGGNITFLQSTNSPKTIKLMVPTEVVFEEVLAGLVDPLSRTSILVHRGVTETLLNSLSSITEVAESSPRIARPSSRTLNRWNGFLGKWTVAESDLAAGAYQNIGNGYLYTFHESDIDMNDQVSSGTASTVKHRESLRHGVPLLFYSPESRVLCLRLGADLPGLYGRAVVAITGRAPDEDEMNGLVRYHDVDETTAKTVFRLLRR